MINTSEAHGLETELLLKVLDTATVLQDNTLTQTTLVYEHGLAIVSGQDGIGKSTMGKQLLSDLLSIGANVVRRKVNWGMEEQEPEHTLMRIAHSSASSRFAQSEAFAILSQLSFQRAREIDRPGMTLFDRGDERFFGWGLTQVQRAIVSSANFSELVRYFTNLSLEPQAYGWKKSVLEDLRIIDQNHLSINSIVNAMLGVEVRERALRTGMVTGFFAPQFRLQVFCSPEETWRRLTGRVTESEYDPQSVNEVHTQVLIQEYSDRRVTSIPVIGGETIVLRINNDGDLNQLRETSQGLAKSVLHGFKTGELVISSNITQQKKKA